MNNKRARFSKAITLDNASLSVSENTGTIEGYAAVFDNVDRDGDVIRRGAFAKTIQDNSNGGVIEPGKIPLMSTHLATGGGTHEVVGSIVYLEEDNYGLKMKAVFSDDEFSQTIRKKAFGGHLRFLSIGYSIVKANAVKVDGKNVNELKELKLWEVSIVPVPANPLAEIIEAKSYAKIEEEVESLTPEKGREYLELFESLAKSLKNKFQSEEEKAVVTPASSDADNTERLKKIEGFKQFHNYLLRKKQNGTL